MPGHTFGDRLREARKLAGITQSDLAARSGVSLSMIRKIEQGSRESRLETARRLASALDIPTTRLLATEPPESAPPVDHDRWAELVAAVTAPGPGVIEEEPTPAGVNTALNSAVDLYVRGRFTDLATLLPALVRDSTALADTSLQMRVLQLAGRLMTQVRLYEPASTAFDRADRLVPDTLHGASMANNRCWLLLRSGRLQEASDLAARWAVELEPRLSTATNGELSAWGAVLLRVAATAARDSRPDDAQHALRLATAAGAMMRPGGAGEARTAGFYRGFSSVTVAMQRAERAMVEDRPDEVLRLADRIGALRLAPTVNSRNRHLLDVANAQVRTRQYGEATETLLRVERDAPQWLGHQRYARDIVQAMTERRRKLTPEMRRLARTIHLPM
ncbi:helix-turn-helix domain-containing protein [Streptomyces alkaliphilus]|uniref:helix-turn-helix domain-containing protein n=1 Tax=Streptomyces alkaliphilus TaxID=1472722 RepID=UPI00117D3810|nr:helix-turn-helix transcriptional regulator [Streptomyces alkaliphilus]MQS05893.1 helix-turn-helix domain-containing protein [Streptomyces alkaliphilus]